MRKSMTMNLLGGTVLSSLMFLTVPAMTAAMAQDEIPDAAEDAFEEDRDNIVVTGSRIRRDEFSSISPIQTIDANAGRSIGLFDLGSLIAQSPTVTGVQFDGSTNAGSPTAAVEGISEGGVGANNIALRGLPASSTLILINSRRLGRSGVRGAPTAPDINLIPSALVERVDILTDGASSIYGSDAVAGVVNVILRSDFEGLEVGGNFSDPFSKGGGTRQISLIGGAANDRGSFTFAAEYFERDDVFVVDRPNFNDCLRDIEVGTDDVVRSVCLDGRPDNSVFIGSQGFVFSTPGATDIGVPGFSSAGALPQNFRTTSIYTLQDEERAARLFEGFERFAIYATGKYDLDLFERDTVYFEGSFANRNSNGIFANEQIFPGVPGLIPQEDANGNLLVNPDGSLQLFDNPLNPFPEDALPVVTTQDLSQQRRSEVNNFRFVLGIEGDLPFATESGWTYDLYGTYDRSYGTSSQAIFFEDAIRESLDTLRLDANGNVICGLERTALSFGFLTPRECVPINFFAPSLFETEGGDKTFATEAERDFITGDSINTTEIETYVFNGVVSGEIFDLPGGKAALAIGGDYREESIDTVNDFVRVNGLGASEVPDTEGNTIGSNNIWGIFAEADLPVSDWLGLNLSGRYSDDAIAGDNFSYSVKGDLRPAEWLRLRVTYGTTFRAPDLRALFLAGSVGTIGGGNDPCLVPNTANNGGVFDPAGDDRPQIVLDNCIADGVDPTALGLQATTGITTTTGGSTFLEPETSTSFTAGAVLTPTWENADISLSVTYFDIDVQDQILATNAANVLAGCFNDEPNLASPLCQFISRNTGNPATATISNVDVPFLNVADNSSTGLDFNFRLRKDLDRLLENSTFNFSVAATHYFEQVQVLTEEAALALETMDIDDVGGADDNVGEIGTPAWSLIGTAVLEKGNWVGTWRTRFIGSGQQDASDNFVDPADQDVLRTACGVLGSPVACRDVDFTDSEIYNDVSIGYSMDSWSITAGISNIFNNTPPLIDQGEGPSRANIVVQSGYDLIGRRAFINVNKSF